MTQEQSTGNKLIAEGSFEDLIEEFTKFTLNTFMDATAESSLVKLINELVELRSEMVSGTPSAVIYEYIDCLMCLFDSMARMGFSTHLIVESFKNKLMVNKGRKWIKNPDNTYSHVKNQNQ